MIPPLPVRAYAYSALPLPIAVPQTVGRRGCTPPVVPQAGGPAAQELIAVTNF